MDLLQLESVPATSSPPKKSAEPSGPNSGQDGKSSRGARVEDSHEGDEQDEENGGASKPPPLTMDNHPTLVNSKFPPLRRAALHFLALLIRACISRVYDMGSTGMLIPDVYIPRAKTILGYVASSDEDTVVRIMAREAREELGQLSNALLGM